VFGARLSVMQAVTLILVSVTVTSVLTLAFAPISLFFLISAHNYQFFKLLNVCVLTLTALVGLRFLTDGMRALDRHQTRLRAESVPVQPPAAAAPEVIAAAPDAQPVAAPAGAVAADPVMMGAVAAGAVPASPVAAPAGVVMAVPNGGMVRVAPPRPVPHRPPAQPAGERSGSMTLLYIWILLFGFVGTQLAWTLRPFFGDPGRPFSLFRHISGTFYADIVHTIARVFSG
jgi:hypothetical protein